jgi:plastocyanin
LRSSLLAWVACATLLGCEQPDPSLQPDETLRAELGLTERDRVHRVTLTGGEAERADPAAVSVEIGALVEFVTTDWLVHEVIFEADSVGATAWAYLERTDQTASPPLINRASRYVLSFEGAPPGRYPFLLEGNGAPGRGVIIVREPEVSVPRLAPPPRNP